MDDILQGFLSGASDDGASEIFSVYSHVLRDSHSEEQIPVTDSHRIAFDRLIWTAARNPSSEAAREAQQVFSHLPKFLEPLAFERLDQLLGGAALVSDELIKLDQLEVQQSQNPLSHLERMNARASARHLQSGFLTWACCAASRHVDRVKHVLAFMKSLPEDRDELRAEIVAHIAKMTKSVETLGAVLPTLYSSLLGPSPSLRASVADTIGDLESSVAQHLPDLVFEGLVAQLSDPYVIVHRASVRVLDQTRFPAQFDARVSLCLRQLILAYAQSRDSDDFLLTCIDIYVRRHAPSERLTEALGARLVGILMTISPGELVRRLRFVGRRLRGAPGYPTLLCRMFLDTNASDYHDNDLVEELRAIAPHQISAHQSDFEATAQHLPRHRHYMRGHFIEALTRAGAWEAAVSVSKHHVGAIEDSARERSRRLLAGLHRIASDFERSIAAATHHDLPKLATEWAETRRALEHDYAINKTRRDPLNGLLG